VIDDTATEVGAAVTADSLQVLLDVLKLQRRVRDRLGTARTERFRDGDSPYEVGLDSVCPRTDAGLLPDPSRCRLERADDERWHEVHRAMYLAGYPPAAAGGRCDSGEAVAAVPPCGSAGDRTIRCPPESVEVIGEVDCGDAEASGGLGGPGLRVNLDGGRVPLDLDLSSSGGEGGTGSSDLDVRGLLDEAALVHLTHHSAAALEAARSLGGALADTPPLAVLFEPAGVERRYGDRDHGVGTLVDAALLEAVEAAPAFPQGRTVELLERALAEGPFCTTERVAVVRLLAGDVETIRLRYGTGVPRLVGAIADVTDCRLVPLPQTDDALLSRSVLPGCVERLAEEFPGKQRLSPADCEAIATAIDRPTGAVAAPGPTDRFRASERCARLAESGDLSVSDAFHLEVSPWVPAPTSVGVDAVVEHGRVTAEALLAFDDRHGRSLGRAALDPCWERAAGAEAGSLPTER
jgi:hypothetical protein